MSRRSASRERTAARYFAVYSIDGQSYDEFSVWQPPVEKIIGLINYTTAKKIYFQTSYKEDKKYHEKKVYLFGIIWNSWFCCFWDDLLCCVGFRGWSSLVICFW